jgi:DNA polymerase III subunit gamma/tau
MKLSFYRKYRPQTFDQVVAQEHVARTLKHAVEAGSVAHAYVFAGPRGIGKTSMAKILAKALNCTGPDGSVTAPTITPCGVCESCRTIAAGTSLDVIEMDAASNRGIDDIRELRDKVAFAPVQGRSKVYIIDEAHMLTKEAFNALLKTLEEPPPHAIFILATTEPHKIIETILSRCQRFDFRRPLTRDIVKVLRTIVEGENAAAAAGDPEAEAIAVDDDALAIIAAHADGGFRDAIGTLDKLSTLYAEHIGREQVELVLGAIDAELLFEITDIVIERDSAAALFFVQRLADENKSYQQFIVYLLRHLRQLFVVHHIGAVHELDDEQRARLERALEQSTHVAAERLERLTAQANQLDERQLIHVIETLGQAQGEIKAGLDARLQLELALVKATRPQLDHTVAGLEERLRRLESAQLTLGGAAALPDAGAMHPPDAAGAARSTATAAKPPSAPPRAAGPSPQPPAGDTHETPAAAEPQPPAGDTQLSRPAELTLVRVTAAWPLVLEYLQATDVSLAATLASSRPAELEGSRLTIAVASNFALSTANRSGNDALVAAAVEQTLGQRPHVAFRLTAGGAGEEPTSDAGASSSGAAPAADAAAPPQTSLSFAEKIRLVEQELDARMLSDDS